MPRKLIEHTCLYCNEKFFTEKLQSKYCCIKHNGLARSVAAAKRPPLPPRVRVRVEKTCIICESLFSALSGARGSKTCSRKCSASLRTQDVIRHTVSCAHCGKEFQSTEHSGGANRKFCDMDCLRASNAITSVKHRNCIVCGIEFCPIVFVPKIGRYTPDRQLATCSEKCRDLSNKGELNWNWQGGKTEYHRTTSWKIAAEKARARDKHICKRCGKKQSESDRKLDVHHIKPFYDVNNTKKAHKLSNLITLCRSCHRVVESSTKQDHQIILPFEMFAQINRRSVRTMEAL